MDDKYTIDKITSDEIKSSVSYLNDNVSKNVKLLNEMRLHTIPETIQLRKQDDNAFLEKTELVVLVDWRA